MDEELEPALGKALKSSPSAARKAAPAATTWDLSFRIFFRRAAAAFAAAADASTFSSDFAAATEGASAEGRSRTELPAFSELSPPPLSAPLLSPDLCAAFGALGRVPPAGVGAAIVVVSEFGALLDCDGFERQLERWTAHSARPAESWS